jgi:putative transposase
MPRQARKKSESGIYHVLLRGINRQTIFEDKEDIDKLFKIIGIYKAELNCSIYAYCFMHNHVHLLIRSGGEELATFMRKVGAKYVYWYNQKYDRVGGLFQDRYKSEPVENDSYFLTVLRYIHLNPVKAGICKTASDYKDSSYNDYIQPRKNQLTDTAFALSMLSRKQFTEYHNEGGDEDCLEIRDLKRVGESKAAAIIKATCQCNNAAEFQALSREKRDSCLAQLKEQGLTVRQIERLTGINRGVVQKA